MVIKRFPWVDSRLQLFRRRLLARGAGYPNWKEILDVSQSHGSRSTLTSRHGAKVLFATSIGSHLAAMQMESTLAVALALRGCHVQALLCDGILPGCQMCEPRFFPNTRRFAKYGPSKDLCGHCYAPGRKVYEDIGIPVHAYSDHLTADDKTLADKLASTIAVSDIEAFELDGLKLGEHAKAGALRFFARATIDDEPQAEPVLRRYLKAAILTALSVKKLLQREKYDVAVFHHGIYVPQGIIGEVARQQGVRVVNWNPAYRKNCFIFSHDDTYHHTLMDEPVSVWEKMRWSAKQEETITRYLRSRWEGENDWIRFHENPYFEKDRIMAEIGCDARRPIIGCLTNVMWDAQLHYPANAFANMLEWLLFTVRYFANRPDLQLVIRVHPAEIRGSVPTRQPVVDELRKHFPKLPDNVFVVPPESNISTYVLSELCDSVIIYGTKTGVELTSMGIPVIVAGEAWIRNKGITHDANSVTEYEAILEQLPVQKRLASDITTRAKKYAYHFFFRRMIPINIFKTTGAWPPFRFVGKLDDLDFGGDAGLDCVCNGILDEQPFIFESRDS
ncbi:MAG: capsule biosynthesis protein [Sideroxyarcus sp.]